MSSSPPPAARIVPRRVADARREADRILLEARAEAARIVRITTSEANQMRALARSRGREEALAQYSEQTVRALKRVDAWTDELERRLVGLARACAEKILSRELSLCPEAVVDIVRAATREVRWATDVRVFIHPDDEDLVRGRSARIRDELAPHGCVRVETDPSIRRGGCRVSTELGDVDASLETQLDAIECALDDDGLAPDPPDAGSEAPATWIPRASACR